VGYAITPPCRTISRGTPDEAHLRIHRMNFEILAPRGGFGLTRPGTARPAEGLAETSTVGDSAGSTHRKAVPRSNWAYHNAGHFSGRLSRLSRRAMQFLFELAPIIAFVIAYKLGGIYVATTHPHGRDGSDARGGLLAYAAHPDDARTERRSGIRVRRGDPHSAR